MLPETHEKRPSPGLYLVSTPIGNASDITLRALTLLRMADVIACEDTRVTRSLCELYKIRTPLLSYHDHNESSTIPPLIERLKRGEVIAQVSDAGMPGISDPGYKLIQACLEEEIAFTVIPGASSILTALVLSGLPTDRFCFGGFLPSKQSARLTMLQDFKEDTKSTLIFFEAPHRLKEMLQDTLKVLGNRPAAVARELTKKFEEVKRGSLQDLLSFYETHGAPKGEMVVLIGKGKAPEITSSMIDQALHQALLKLTPRDAASHVALELGISRKEVYKRALLLKETLS